MFCSMFLTLKLLRLRNNPVVLETSDPVFAWKGVSDSWLSGSGCFKGSGSRMWAAQVLLEVVTVTWFKLLPGSEFVHFKFTSHPFSWQKLSSHQIATLADSLASRPTSDKNTVPLAKHPCFDICKKVQGILKLVKCFETYWWKVYASIWFFY